MLVDMLGQLGQECAWQNRYILTQLPLIIKLAFYKLITHAIANWLKMHINKKSRSLNLSDVKNNLVSLLLQ